MDDDKMETLEKALKKTRKLPKRLRKSIERQLVTLKDLEKDVMVDLYGEGLLIYSLGDSPLVVATVHDGSVVPKGIELKQTEEERNREEDLFSGELYMPIFLDNGGVWVTSHISRYVVDLNRSIDEAIFKYEAPDGMTNLAGKKDEEMIRARAGEYYKRFYAAFAKILDDKRFLFSGHTMCDRDNRGEFALEYWSPEKAEPLKVLLEREGFRDITVNDPFSFDQGISALNFFAEEYLGRDRHMVFETNKKMYMDEARFKRLPDFSKMSRRISNVVSEYLHREVFEDKGKIRSYSFF